MVEILFCLEYRFMRKTFAAIERHLDAEAAYLPLRRDVIDCWDGVEQAVPASPAPADVDATVRAVDPAVVVTNSRYRPDEVSFPSEYPLVHVRHGSSVGRGEIRETTGDLDGVVDVALAPGEYWASRYREQLHEGVHAPVVGVPEADDLVGTEPPRERRVLYAPTNHTFGRGCYVETAEHVLDVFEGADYDLRFRPHPHDRRDEPGRSVTERCTERIAGMDNVVYDDETTPAESLLWADLLVSDYSGIVTEWLHTGRPLVQVTDVAADVEVPRLGYPTDRLSLDLIDDVYTDGYPEQIAREIEARRADLGIPMDGRAGERAAREVTACTP